METLLITKLTIESYLRCISLKKLFSQKTQNTMYNYQGYPSIRIFLLLSHDVFTLGKSFSLTQQFGETGFQKKKRKSLPASRFTVTLLRGLLRTDRNDIVVSRAVREQIGPSILLDQTEKGRLIQKYQMASVQRVENRWNCLKSFVRGFS